MVFAMIPYFSENAREIGSVRDVVFDEIEDGKSSFGKLHNESQGYRIGLSRSLPITRMNPNFVHWHLYYT